MNANNEEKKPVILTANDVQSVLLTPQESQRLAKEHTDSINEYDRLYNTPALEEYHRRQAEVYDRIARDCGFTQFEQCEDGNGVRDYTVGNKRMVPQAKEKVQQWSKTIESDEEMKELYRMLKDNSEKRREFVTQQTQIYYQNILELTRPRMDAVDANGQHIMSAEQYLKLTEGMDKEQLHELTRPITATVKTKEGKQFNVDASVAPFIRYMQESGYRTSVCCSGMLADHPNYRYVEGNEITGYRKGEPIYYNKQHNGAYVGFWKAEDEIKELLENIGEKTNSQKDVDFIRKAGKESGWIVSDENIFFTPCVVLRLPSTYDGTSEKEILDETNRRTNEKYPGLYEKDFLDWIEKRTPIRMEVVKEHGGIVRWTDNMVKDRWHNLTMLLERERKLDRIDKTEIQHRKDGSYWIKCTIDGREQLAKPIPYYLLEKATHGEEKVVAEKLFADALAGWQSLDERKGRSL